MAKVVGDLHNCQREIVDEMERTVTNAESFSKETSNKLYQCSCRKFFKVYNSYQTGKNTAQVYLSNVYPSKSKQRELGLLPPKKKHFWNRSK